MFESCKGRAFNGRIEPAQILFSGGPQTLNFDYVKAAIQWTSSNFMGHWAQSKYIGLFVVLDMDTGTQLD